MGPTSSAPTSTCRCRARRHRNQDLAGATDEVQEHMPALPDGF